MIEKTSGSHRIQKRETAAAVVGDIFGAMIPSLGVVLNSIKIRKLSTIVDNMLTKFSGAIILIDAELAAERAMTLQNRLALDILLAKDGGVCKMIGARHCCTYIPDNSVKIKTMLANLTKESADLKELKEPGVREKETSNDSCPRDCNFDLIPLHEVIVLPCRREAIAPFTPAPLSRPMPIETVPMMTEERYL
ncbi:hypothetical protein NDU88_003513 [Pleurodeles waltl]|uniref:Uncharacterized protein n=1 Tax=Pleurodeles waltl TaxID=8319 RepID=A0AAV7PID1_PLEWA|nr:hypothetical protein NDU88_003513 [Pleurodeles waltl]